MGEMISKEQQEMLGIMLEQDVGWLTTPDGANAHFMERFVDRRWAERAPAPDGLAGALTCFRLTPDGRAMLSKAKSE